MTPQDEVKLMVTHLKKSIRDSQDNTMQLIDLLRFCESSHELNTYADLSTANKAVSDRLRRYAEEDCEGSHNVGSSSYSQIFSVDGTKYEGTLSVKYDRHDKTYYYVDYTEYSCEEYE